MGQPLSMALLVEEGTGDNIEVGKRRTYIYLIL